MSGCHIGPGGSRIRPLAKKREKDVEREEEKERRGREEKSGE